MNEYEALITKFYSAFARQDWKTMQACYHPDITFSDPVFPALKGNEAKAMWHMLAVSAKNFSLSFNSVKATENNGSCYWEARYDFSRTGRRVYNKIWAEFSFKDGLIYTHQDWFNFWRWSRMALGLSGWMLGWTHLVQNKVRLTAARGLEKFIETHTEYQSK